MLRVVLTEEQIEIEVRSPEEEGLREVKHESLNIGRGEGVGVSNQGIGDESSQDYEVEEVSEVEERSLYEISRESLQRAMVWK